MIKIDFQEPTTVEWRDWCQKCDQARDEFIAAVARGESPVISDDLYKEQRHVYLDHAGQFHGKCAYCESPTAGELDHFRPKKRVTDENHRVVMIRDENGIERPHPGYYWLAYDWRNLVPSCNFCNRPTTAISRGKPIGKRNCFPVKGFRAASLGEENREEPLLLHPLFQDPTEHLTIDETGVFEAITPEGQMCIDVFGLNVREGLVEGRNTTYRNVKGMILTTIAALLQTPGDISGVSENLAELQSFIAGERPYSAAARVAIQREGQKLKPIIDLLISD